MADRTFFDFDLLIERATVAAKDAPRYRARVLQSPAGQANSEFVLPFSQIEIENLMLRVGRPRSVRVRRLESPELQAAKAFGGKLFDALFTDEVRGAYRASLDAARREEKGLRVRLRFAETPELMDLP